MMEADSEEFSQDEEAVARQYRENRHRQFDGAADDSSEDEGLYDMEDAKGKISDWIRERKTVQFIRASFNKFLRHFKDDRGQDVYEERINEMCAANK